MSPMCPYMALDTTKIHTPITLGVRPCIKPLVFKLRRRSPCGFDSHRPLHFSLSGVSLRCLRTRLSLSPSSHSLDAATTVPLIECVDRPLGRVPSRWSHPCVIDPFRTIHRSSMGVCIHSRSSHSTKDLKQSCRA